MLHLSWLLSQQGATRFLSCLRSLLPHPQSMALYQGASRRLTNQSRVGIPTRSPLMEDHILALVSALELVPEPELELEPEPELELEPVPELVPVPELAPALELELELEPDSQQQPNSWLATMPTESTIFSFSSFNLFSLKFCYPSLLCS